MASRRAPTDPEAAPSPTDEMEEDLVALIVHSVPLAVAILDAEDRVRAMRGAALAIFGVFETGQVVTQADLVTLAAAARTRGRCDGEGYWDGAALALTAIPLARGKVGLVAFDVTDQRRTAADLIQARLAAETANRSKSIFLANMSHELRTPLNAIIGFADVMRQGYFGPIDNPRYAEYLGDIRDSGTHLLSLLSDLLDISRIEAGQYHLREEAVDLATEIAAALRFLRESAARGAVAIETLLDRLPPIWAEARAIRQILINLIGNALKFTPPGGRIVVSAFIADGRPTLSVRDTGTGMDDAMRHHLESGMGGFRADTKIAGQGSGLGLPIVRSLVAVHGGTVEIRSAPGQGTTVIVTLPPARIMDMDHAADPRPWDVQNDDSDQ